MSCKYDVKDQSMKKNQGSEEKEENETKIRRLKNIDKKIEIKEDKNPYCTDVLKSLHYVLQTGLILHSISYLESFP